MALGMAAPAFADADAQGAAVGSPGVLSGNVVQVPVHVPVNVCGNTVNVVGLLNPAFGNVCVNN
nr:chaplin [Streptomyces sp. REN17]